MAVLAYARGTVDTRRRRYSTMVQAMEREKSLRESVMAMKPTPRVERLRQKYLGTKDKAVIDMTRIRTRVMKETEGEPRPIREAKAFAATVREMPINIYPDELFVGWLFCEPRGSNLTGGMALMLEDELDTSSTREIAPFLITDEDKRELREELIPYWKAHRHNHSRSTAHWSTGYEKVLEKGVLGVKKDAEDRLAGLDLTKGEEVRKVPFFQSVIMALEAAAEIGGRFAAKARELAEREEDSRRKAELLEIAEACDWVPANPARTFREAIQSVWFTHVLHAWDNEMSAGMGPGRPDQWLYPYYERDIEEGRITKEAAQELIDCWFMRYSQQYPIYPSGGIGGIGGGGYGNMTPMTPGQHINIGGLKPDGTDASNELSYMFVEAMMHNQGMTEPTFSLLVHSRTPEDLLIKACQLTSLGGGFPMYINHDLRIEGLLCRSEVFDAPPITLELARTGCSIGCHESVLPNVEAGIGGMALSLGAALELALTNGVGWSDKGTGAPSRQYIPFEGIERIFERLETGDPRQFKSFEEVREAYHRQVARMIRNGVIRWHMGEVGLTPKAFTSALTEDCIERGMFRHEGGARYYAEGIFMTGGPVDAGNSLAAIRKLVFDDKKTTMAELCDALDANFEGYEDIRKLCLEAPKFGNDDDYVDEQVAWALHMVAEEGKKYKTRYGGGFFPCQVPSAAYITAGSVVGALPSGRLAGEPMAPAMSPNVGTDVKGPTAILKSLGKVNNVEQSMGQTSNMRLDPAVFEKEDGFKRLADLIRVFVDQKIDHVQINVVSSDTLRAAQREPDKYKDLTVKVAGYNARFVEIHKVLQDGIIARTEHGL